MFVRKLICVCKKTHVCLKIYITIRAKKQSEFFCSLSYKTVETQEKLKTRCSNIVHITLKKNKFIKYSA